MYVQFAKRFVATTYLIPLTLHENKFNINMKSKSTNGNWANKKMLETDSNENLKQRETSQYLFVYVAISYVELTLEAYNVLSQHLMSFICSEWYSKHFVRSTSKVALECQVCVENITSFGYSYLIAYGPADSYYFCQQNSRSWLSLRRAVGRGRFAQYSLLQNIIFPIV